MPTKKKKAPPSKKNSLKMVEQEKKPKEGISFPVVGIGASAGGLETLNAFFSIMPPDLSLIHI